MNRSIFIFMILFVVACSKAPEPSGSVTSQTVSPASTVKSEVAEVAPEPVDPRLAKLSPLEAVKDLDQQVEGYHLGQNLTEQQLQDNAALKRKIIRGTFDIEELSRLALSKHWDAISEDQRKHFVSLMTRLLEKKAIFSKEQLRGDNKLYTINYKKETYEDAEKSKSVVTTQMVVPKKKMDLTLTYKLLKKPQGWKIFDVIVDDASLLNNYKFQFDRIIQKGGFEDLVKRMESKLSNIGTEA